MVTACADNDGKTESLPFTKPEILEIASEPKVIIVEVPAVDNSTVIQGKLAQGYVKGATVIADIIQTDSLVGNLQQDPEPQGGRRYKDVRRGVPMVHGDIGTGTHGPSGQTDGPQAGLKGGRCCRGHRTMGGKGESPGKTWRGIPIK